MNIENLEVGLLGAVVRRALRHGGDFAEVFAEDRRTLAMRLDDGAVEQVEGGTDVGFGVRLCDGERTLYAHSDLLEEASLLRAADVVATARRDGGPVAPVDLTTVQSAPQVHGVAVAPEGVSILRKRGLLETADSTARGVGAQVTQATVMYAESRQQVLIANSLGEAVRDDRTRVRLAVVAIARRGDVIQTGHESVGASAGIEVLDEATAASVARVAAERATVMLDARPAPAGVMPVVLANGFGGVLFHEACGHGLEADSVVKGASIYAGKLGQTVAAPIVDAFDDGTIVNGWGSAACDDEGVPSHRTQLISKGRLCGYLHDRLSAGRMGAALTGNGRRQSFRHVPVPRMTTTYIAPGEAAAEDIIAATAHGFYAKSLSGGQVEPASGAFVFGVAEGYLIENGRITTPLRGATLIGSGIEVLSRIDMIGTDMDIKPGMCGKDGQAVPVGTGQASLRVASMTVGGTA